MNEITVKPEAFLREKHTQHTIEELSKNFTMSLALIKEDGFTEEKLENISENLENASLCLVQLNARIKYISKNKMLCACGVYLKPDCGCDDKAKNVI